MDGCPAAVARRAGALALAVLQSYRPQLRRAPRDGHRGWREVYGDYDWDVFWCSRRC